MTVIHRMSGKPIFRIWSQMNERCHNKNAHNYKYYGARGIKVCEQWRRSFLNFYNDMGDRPEGLTLDRIDNNKGYSKENCRWADKKTQSLNSRKCKFNMEQINDIRNKFKTKSILELVNEYEVTFGTICRIVNNEGYKDENYIPPQKYTSQFMGVCKQGNKWVATYRRKHLGMFNTELEAFNKYKEIKGIALCQE